MSGSAAMHWKGDTVIVGDRVTTLDDTEVLLRLESGEEIIPEDIWTLPEVERAWRDVELAVTIDRLNPIWWETLSEQERDIARSYRQALLTYASAAQPGDSVGERPSRPMLFRSTPSFAADPV